jgi:5-enolpyruvylshikimate-3-phosphate synthase
VEGSGEVRGGHLVIDASASSQFVSALLLVGARFTEGLHLEHVGKPVPSLDHINMTVAVLRGAGVVVDDSVPNHWVLPRAHPRLRPADRAGPVQRRAIPGRGPGLRRNRPDSGLA